MTENTIKSPTLVEFAVANGSAATFPLVLFFSREPKFLLTGFAAVVVVTLLMFRPMRACPGPRSRAAVLLVFTLAYLILFGALLAWSAGVGDSEPASLSATLAAGLVIAIAGFLPALVTAFPLLLLANSLLSWPAASPSTASR
ncbi:MAG TPA: hypothetical protein VHC20_06565 [Candidatus Paceibacterota bacterium]|nr:hypothetical protein [Candidatus Paceibacterota bacterium]